MWFKNIKIMELAKNPGYKPEELESELANIPFQPCGKVNPITFGWIPPLGNPESAPLVYASTGYMIFCLKIEEKILPPSVLREQLEIKVNDIEERESRKLFKHDKQRMKDELYHTLLAQAFTRSTKIYALIDTLSNRLIIDTTSSKRLDLFLNCYSKSAISYPANGLELVSPSAIMTRWLKQHRYPAGISLTLAAHLQDTNDERSSVRIKHKDLQSNGVQSFLQEGSQVIQLGLNWRDQLQFTLCDDFSIKSMSFGDEVLEAGKDNYTETEEERFATNFIMMAETLHRFLGEFLSAFLEPEETKFKRVETAAKVA